ncbi:LysR family transcriptional regulator substrate-binding protein [Nonomuraea jabiensis]|uniref:LysR substrate-binding domain-containing protein n=1 Tax=Nonomuraea jabiensis TaxID=882448 RepID=A0A7W9GEQ1_9ACTN|nr:LysR family transcriptional regulator substrate-binding protein [Nonomuraea jabiensis]MBB5782430.1 hypothetical protein [Nonomuraea jabiensis]
MRRSPRLHLTLETGRGDELSDRVVSGHLDVAFVFYEPFHTDLRVRVLARYPMVAVFREQAPGTWALVPSFMVADLTAKTGCRAGLTSAMVITEKTTDVLIVGAGPTGVTLAVDLPAGTSPAAARPGHRRGARTPP